ncbi:hypothetical protein WM40_22840 [Robbsia andropogonis]|uniref:Uncharacterized protein n=1 Tax=Robbsia andropogonis TaxID=28092 RepID=A0A0F5JV02_9BURK|nr:hypothetical protein WM40_22840 [Robbsia andropogonis]
MARKAVDRHVSKGLVTAGWPSQIDPTRRIGHAVPDLAFHASYRAFEAARKFCSQENRSTKERLNPLQNASRYIAHNGQKP